MIGLGGGMVRITKLDAEGNPTGETLEIPTTMVTIGVAEPEVIRFRTIISRHDHGGWWIDTFTNDRVHPKWVWIGGHKRDHLYQVLIDAVKTRRRKR